MHMTIPHPRHQDLDMRLGQFGIMRCDIFRWADMRDLCVFDNDAGIGDWFATSGDEQVGGNAEGGRGFFVRARELESCHLVGEEVGVPHFGDIACR